MKKYTRMASVVWLGSQENGRGAISTPSAALKEAPYASGSESPLRRTNPPELIAAAHAGSFSLTLANELGVAGYCADQIDTVATVTMEHVTTGWTMTQVHLDVAATVPRATQCDFVDAALRAKANCPVSRLLSANISMRAKLMQTRANAKPGPGRQNRNA